MRPPEARAHAVAVGLLVLATLLWSIAGVVTRRLDVQSGPALTLWRSVFAALTVAAYLGRDPRRLWSTMTHRAGWLWLSGAMWAVMFSCFMIALTLTSVANTLIVYSISPLLTAILAGLVLRERIAARTVFAIAAVMLGLLIMFVEGSSGRGVLGMVVALGVPCASAINYTALKKAGATLDMVPAIFVGCLVSIVAMLPFCVPGSTSRHDLGLLGLLGVAQLGIPCIMMVKAMRHLGAAEASLLALLEIVFGVLWAWLWAHEAPSVLTLCGGALVLGALVANELGADHALTTRPVRRDAASSARPVR